MKMNWLLAGLVSLGLAVVLGTCALAVTGCQPSELFGVEQPEWPDLADEVQALLDADAWKVLAATRLDGQVYIALHILDGEAAEAIVDGFVIMLGWPGPDTTVTFYFVDGSEDCGSGLQWMVSWTFEPEGAEAFIAASLEYRSLWMTYPSQFGAALWQNGTQIQLQRACYNGFDPYNLPAARDAS